MLNNTTKGSLPRIRINVKLLYKIVFYFKESHLNISISYIIHFNKSEFPEQFYFLMKFTTTHMKHNLKSHLQSYQQIYQLIQ